ncbi:MAG: phytanoyl-CoA dioxygenase family protein [Pseudomonadota bacterium]|nr:phytanoyl-CoA dioxygenase family protein [Pseudomonadota bacterium]
MFTDEEKFRFDLQGFIVLRGVLTRAECTLLSKLSDTAWPRQPGDGAFRRTEAISRWGGAFLNLIDHPCVLPYLVELIGPRLRADHDYCIFMRSGADGQNIHGGPMRYESDHWYHYHDGVMRNGLMVATWVLNDAEPGDGGFVCIPGSHKTNFIDAVPRDVLTQEYRPDYVIQPELRAGDVLLFTEALIHGTATWRGSQERRALLYKYSPPHSSWAKVPYNLQHYPNASPQQQRLMAPASVEDHAKVLNPAEY